MKVRAIRPYSGPVDAGGKVSVFDITVVPQHNYYLSAGIVVSNSKRISMLDVNALLSHGATETLRDSGAIRGQRNEDYWVQFMQGYTPRDPKIPLVYEKFVNQLKSAGINVVREGSQLNVMALTNKDVDQLVGDRVIKSGDTVHFDKDLRPVPGGLFDSKATGGHGGRQWSAIELAEPIPNPVMEEPIRRLLGLTEKRFTAILSGDETLDGFGSGPKAIADALDNINVTKEIMKARVQMTAASASKRDEAVRKLGYLKSAQKSGLHPRDWILNKVPVLPPIFRPVSVMGSSGLPLVSDANYLYKDLLEANKNLLEMRKELGDDGVGAERLAVYHAFKAVTGLGEPVATKTQEKQVTGILKSIFGNSPKFGVVQRKLLSSTVDNVGRAVITPNPDYDMDTIGIPENKAFEVYGKFVARRMRRSGMPLTQALVHIRDKSELARDALQQEMEARPVFVNRAPVLHRFGIMAFKPKLVKGDVLQVSPLIVKGFNADFDGDAMQFHVPTDPKAVEEAYERMLPSKNLISPSDFKSPVHIPGQEYLGGLYRATTAKKEKSRPRIFRSKEEAIAAFQRGDIAEDDAIEIMGS